MSKKWFRVADTYGVEIAPGQDPVVVLAATGGWHPGSGGRVRVSTTVWSERTVTVASGPARHVQVVGGSYPIAGRAPGWVLELADVTARIEAGEQLCRQAEEAAVAGEQVSGDVGDALSPTTVPGSPQSRHGTGWDPRHPRYGRSGAELSRP